MRKATAISKVPALAHFENLKVAGHVQTRYSRSIERTGEGLLDMLDISGLYFIGVNFPLRVFLLFGLAPIRGDKRSEIKMASG